MTGSRDPVYDVADDQRGANGEHENLAIHLCKLVDLVTPSKSLSVIPHTLNIGVLACVAMKMIGSRMWKNSSTGLASGKQASFHG